MTAGCSISRSGCSANLHSCPCQGCLGVMEESKLAPLVSALELLLFHPRAYQPEVQQEHSGQGLGSISSGISQYWNKNTLWNFTRHCWASLRQLKNLPLITFTRQTQFFFGKLKDNFNILENEENLNFCYAKWKQPQFVGK